MELKKESTPLSEVLKSKDSRTIIKINGHEILMKDYMEDPKKYNSLPFTGISPEQVQSECTENLEIKRKFSVKPINAERYKESK